jgi:deoxyribodipyrimidine photo-lyase
MERSIFLNKHEPTFEGNILYLMIRDCRVEDNWALFLAQKQALKYKLGLVIGFAFIIDISNRQLQFLLEGLKEVELKAKKLNIPFMIIKDLNSFIKKNKIAQIISDFSPLKPVLDYKKKINISLIDVDNHNIVPVWVTSDKQEYAARTIRPKIYKNFKKYAIEPEKIKKHSYPFTGNYIKPDWKIYKPKVNNKPITWCHGGYDNGMKQLDFFLKNIKGYASNRNDPKQNAVSNLSPWLHFGNISSLRCYLEVKKIKHKIDANAFIEEIVIRKELSDNYCYYNKNYDSIQGLPNWALKTLKDHKNDKREKKYSFKELLNYRTEDKAWNFSQKQLIEQGKIHTYMRMYWGKKVIEWTNNIEEAYKIIIYLNDTYSIDGNDPNGFVGVLWCFGLHDRAWKERNIYGKVRIMTRIGKEF